MAYLSDSERSRKKNVLKIKRSLQKEEADHKLSDFSGSDDEEIDFSKEIHPIGYYINDREKMIEQMFSVIKNNKLKKMLPPVLKNYSLEEIKADCLVHLLGMSKKRIFAVLQGRDLNSSSDSETDTTNSVLGSDSPEEPQITSSTHIKSDGEEIDDTLDLSVSKNDLDALITQDKLSSKPIAPRKRKDKSKSDGKLLKKIKAERSPSLIEISDDEIDLKKKKKEDKKLKKKSNSKKSSKVKHKHAKEKPKKVDTSGSNGGSSNEEFVDEDDKADPKKGKSLLEILELEMRARAIRALLESAPSSTEPVPIHVINIKPDPESDKSEKVSIPIPSPEPEIVDESDSAEVVEIINENDDDAIVILDDTDEQILEPEKKPESCTKDVPKTNETEMKIEKVLKTGDTETDVTWSQRWAESKGVKTIVQNSKICANIRKRMRFARMLKQKQQQEQQNQSKTTDDAMASQFSGIEEGSVDQLEFIKQIEAQNKVNKLQVDEGIAEPAATPDDPVTARDEQSNTDKKELENGEIDDTKSTSSFIEKQTSSNPASDVEIVEKNIECHIDLTDA